MSSPRGWALGVAICILSAYLVARPGRSHLGETKTYATTSSQHAAITLSDGSTVTLGDASTLVLPPGFGTRTRSLTVTGRAHFQVRQSNGIPFIVRAGNAESRVLGTSFIVQKYANDSAARIVVVDGRVALRAQRRAGPDAEPIERILTAGMLGEISDSGASTTRSNVVVEEYTGWTAGRLVFNDTRMADAIPEIERRYGVTIHCDSALRRRYITVTLSAVRLTEALDVLALTLQSQYARSGPDGRVITFTAGRRAFRRVPVRPTSTPEVQYGR